MSTYFPFQKACWRCGERKKSVVWCCVSGYQEWVNMIVSRNNGEVEVEVGGGGRTRPSIRLAPFRIHATRRTASGATGPAARGPESAEDNRQRQSIITLHNCRPPLARQYTHLSVRPSHLVLVCITTRFHCRDTTNNTFDTTTDATDLRELPRHALHFLHCGSVRITAITAVTDASAVTSIFVTSRTYSSTRESALRQTWTSQSQSSEVRRHAPGIQHHPPSSHTSGHPPATEVSESSPRRSRGAMDLLRGRARQYTLHTRRHELRARA